MNIKTLEQQMQVLKSRGRLPEGVDYWPRTNRFSASVESSNGDRIKLGTFRSAREAAHEIKAWKLRHRKRRTTP